MYYYDKENKQHMKFAIIGCGRISYKHVEAIINNYNNGEVVLAALCDIKGENAQRRANEYVEKMKVRGIEVEMPKVFTDYKTMINNMKIDVVTIAAESGYHADIAIWCMEYGVNVIVEKPMAMSVEAADKMIEMSEKNNVKLCVCHQNRFNPAVQKLRETIEKDRFGKIINGTARILWNRNMEYYRQAPWRGTTKLDGGCLMNQCIHDIDLLQWMMCSDVESVYAQKGTYIHDIEGEDFGAIVIRFKNGAIGIIEGNVCVYPKNLEETLSIFGEKGTVVIGGLAVNKIETWRFADGDREEEEKLKQWQIEEPDTVYGYGHTPLFSDMIEAIKNNRKPYVDGIEGKKGMEIILMAYESSKKALPVYSKK